MRACRSTHMRSQEREPDLVRAGGSEIHMDMSEEPFCMEIYRKKCTWTCQKSHFVWKFTGKKAQAQVTGAILWLPGTTFWMEVEAHVTRAILYGNLQEKCRTRMLRSAFCVEIYRKKRTWTCHKSHFVWKFTGKMPEATWEAPTLCGNLQEKTRMDIAQGPFCVEIYRKNAGRPRPHLDLHGPLFTLTVRTPSVWPHCLGKNIKQA